MDYCEKLRELYQIKGDGDSGKGNYLYRCLHYSEDLYSYFLTDKPKKVASGRVNRRVSINHNFLKVLMDNVSNDTVKLQVYGKDNILMLETPLGEKRSEYKLLEYTKEGASGLLSVMAYPEDLTDNFDKEYPGPYIIHYTGDNFPIKNAKKVIADIYIRPDCGALIYNPEKDCFSDKWIFTYEFNYDVYDNDIKKKLNKRLFLSDFKKVLPEDM